MLIGDCLCIDSLWLPSVTFRFSCGGGHLQRALSSAWFKGNDSFFAPGLNSDWLWHGPRLKGACVYDSIQPMRCMETFTGAYERETSVFHGTVWPLWLLFVNMGAACPNVKVTQFRREEPRKFWGWMQLCLRLALPPDFSFVNQWIPSQSFFLPPPRLFLKFEFSVTCKDFYWYRPFLGASYHVACTRVTVYFSYSSEVIICPFLSSNRLWYSRTSSKLLPPFLIFIWE